MAEYRSNYGATEDCKLCEKHLDSQDKIFDCEFIRKSSKISMKYDDLFTPNVEVETVRNLEEIHKLRENKLKWADKLPQVHTDGAARYSWFFLFRVTLTW